MLEGSVARSRDEVSTIGRLLLRRWWLIALFIVAYGAAGLIAKRGEGDVFERRLVFVLEPSPQVRAQQVPDVVRGAAEQTSQLVYTIARAIETQRFVPATGDMEAEAAVNPGTQVIQVHLRGPSPQALEELEPQYVEAASGWVNSSYGAYALDLLESTPSSSPTGAGTAQTIALALLVGGLLGVLAALAEAALVRRGWWRRLTIRSPDEPAWLPADEEVDEEAREALRPRPPPPADADVPTSTPLRRSSR